MRTAKPEANLRSTPENCHGSYAIVNGLFRGT